MKALFGIKPPLAAARGRGRAVMVIGLGLLLAWPTASWLHTKWQRRFDSKMVAEAEALARQALLHASQANRGVNAKIGTFRRLQGRGFQRPGHAWMLIPRLEVFRRAEFTKGTIPARIYVVGGSTLRVLRLDYWPKRGGPQPSWDLAGPEELAIDVWISHPKFQR